MKTAQLAMVVATEARAYRFNHLSAFRGFNESEIAEFDRICRFRNNLVHGVEVPQAVEINDVTKILEALLEKLKPGIGH